MHVGNAPVHRRKLCADWSGARVQGLDLDIGARNRCSRAERTCVLIVWAPISSYLNLTRKTINRKALVKLRVSNRA